MITFEQLEVAHINAQEAVKPIKEKLRIAEKQFDKEAKQATAPFTEMLESYLDQMLKDKNNRPIAVGSKLLFKNKEYTVLERGLQLCFGQMFNNSRCLIALIRPDGTISRNERSACSSDLKQYEIIG